MNLSPEHGDQPSGDTLQRELLARVARLKPQRAAAIWGSDAAPASWLGGLAQHCKEFVLLHRGQVFHSAGAAEGSPQVGQSLDNNAAPGTRDAPNDSTQGLKNARQYNYLRSKFASDFASSFDLVLVGGARCPEEDLEQWAHARKLIGPDGVCLFTDYRFGRSEEGSQAVADRLDPTQWNVRFFGSIGTENGKAATMVEVRRQPGRAIGEAVRKARVRFVGNMPRMGYSGGRLLALLFAEALATTGADVEFMVDGIPPMYGDIEQFSRVRLKRIDFGDLSPHVDRSVDIVVVVPAQGEVGMHSEFLRHAIECHARIVLLNFETPNWFNALSPFKRDPLLWEGWDLISRHADLIVSISAESDKWARAYYAEAKPGCLFDFCYTALNTVVADAAPAMRPRLKQIVMLTRMDPHKGSATLAPFAHREFAGYKMLAYVGMGQFPSRLESKWSRRYARAGVALEIYGPISELEKYTVLKSSSLLYYPTLFEGFGLPPLEAAYCLLPTVCSDLPVLREVGGDAFCYVDPANSQEVRAAAWRAMASGEALRREHPRIASIAGLEECGRRLAGILQRVL